MSTSSRRDALDVIRAFAAMAIVVHHVSFASGHTLNSAVGEFTGRLDAGVSVFFVLSGFLLFRPWVSSLLTDDAPPSANAFLIRRALRVFPAYWCALAGLFALGAVSVQGFDGWLATITLTQIYQLDTALLGIVQAWSLATEIGFYVALPFVALGMGHLVKGRPTNQRSLLMLAVLGAISLFAYGFRVAMALWGGSLSSVSGFWVISHADTFAAGMALAVLAEWRMRSAPVDRVLTRWCNPRWPYVASAGAVFVIAATQFELAVGLQSASLNRELARHVAYGLIGLLVVAPYALSGSSGRRSPLVGLVAWLGLVSYGVYLWHQVLIAGDFAESQMPWTLFDGDFWTRFLATVPIAVVLGAASWYLVERPSAKVPRYLARLRRL